MKTLKAAMQASVTELQLEWSLGGSVEMMQVPRELPPLFAGDRLIVYAINTGKQVILPAGSEAETRPLEDFWKSSTLFCHLITETVSKSGNYNKAEFDDINLYYPKN